MTLKTMMRLARGGGPAACKRFEARPPPASAKTIARRPNPRAFSALNPVFSAMWGTENYDSLQDWWPVQHAIEKQHRPKIFFHNFPQHSSLQTHAHTQRTFVRSF